MKFIHAADLHLESPFKGLKNDETPNGLWKQIYESTFKSFERIVNDAIEYDVDFVLLAGDLFDRDNQTPKTYDFFQSQMQKLDENNIDVYMIYGNHDYFDMQKESVSFPKNVHVFGNDVETKTFTLDGKKIAITGFSYANKWITDKKIDEYPVKSDVDVQIGMLHGGLEQTGDHYAPFSLEDLIGKKYDYWALGHIHKRQQLNENPLVFYSGNIQGRHKNEPGDKGYLLVDDSTGKLEATFHATSSIDWLTIDMNMDFVDVESAKNHILQVLIGNKYENMQLISLNIILNSPISDGQRQDLEYRVTNALSKDYEQLNAWIYEINVRLSDNQKMSSIDQDIWDEAQAKVFSEGEIISVSKSLRKYDFIAQHLDDSKDALMEQTKMKLLGGKEDSDED
ncbi:metallophosphoesterase family protein [Apilactobacillus zhangqiuensis]|uniref:metallophosphoesterase family protein n=1 Tax=Apilactobacillus zhangqiuensis TaxID=2841031 RepID=UPI001C7E1BAA|nr:DNA repair exonuclease [Apilactobacillus zhangqiuensis]